MNCYVCAKEARGVPAVALCKHCNAGLCLEHLRATVARRGPGGTFLDCGHDTWSAGATVGSR